MDFGPVMCFGCPTLVRTTLLLLLVPTLALLGALALVWRGERVREVVGWLLLAPSGLVSAAVTRMTTLHGIDWRWTRNDLEFRLIRPAEVALLIGWWMAVLAAALLLRRRVQRRGPSR